MCFKKLNYLINHRIVPGVAEQTAESALLGMESDVLS
jgi:hypothetical protein